MNHCPTRLRPKEAAAFLGVTPSCLAKWRMHNKGPRYHRLGERIVYYILSEIQSWLDECDGQQSPGPDALR